MIKQTCLVRGKNEKNPTESINMRHFINSVNVGTLDSEKLVV